MTELNLSSSLILSANITNKVAIITGGASGVGAQIVRLLSAYGAHPWFCDIDTLAGEALVASTPNSHFIYADVTDWEAAPIYIDYTSPTTGVLLPPAFSTFDTTLTSAIYAAKLALYFFRHNVTTPTSGMITPTPTVSRHLYSHSIIDVQLASSVALALVVMASNPTVNGKSWVVIDDGRCAEAVD
ncbi:hypothetical protein DV736_g3374, partial [Chaetothyriales sp. CBS 134916]